SIAPPRSRLPAPGTPRITAALISGQPRNSRPQLDHLRDLFPVAVTVPGRHQGAPTLEQIAAPVAAFDRALDAMPERLLDHLMRKGRSLVAPIFEARNESRASPPGLRG